MNFLSGIVFVLLILKSTVSTNKNQKFIDDICGDINGQRIYLDYKEQGILEARYHNNQNDKLLTPKLINQKRCSVEFISCPSCIMSFKFRFLNLSRDCGRPVVFDSCNCDYVWIYEPTFDQSSEQFCGRFISSNFSNLEYKSQTRKIVVEFLYNRNYDQAFSLDYIAERNKIIMTGFPKFGNINNSSQTITSPYFPNLYSSDLTMEHIINCEAVNETCRISLVFTDFLLAPSTIMDFFDWNNERIYVTTGNIFRPPVIITSGPSLLIRFYANGATNLGFKAFYSFILGHVTKRQLTPNIDCGGQVNNLGGGITMMNMALEGLNSFDCIWLIKPPETHLHMKTHLYIKVVNFSAFAGNTELTIRQGLTSNGPLVENLKYSLNHFYYPQEREHIVKISQGFYIRLKGLFRPESRLALVYAAFNYKECLAGSDYLCHNKRCISALLKCDGFDHCGDNSDELSISCSRDPHDRRQWSNTPHFLFPKVNDLSDLATSTVAFLLCSFGFVGFILTMILLLYRVNIKSRYQRQIQDHIETINAILEEGVGVIEEEIIISDDPPDYEAPPTYEDVKILSTKRKSSKRFDDEQNVDNISQNGEENSVCQGTSRSCQTTPSRIPDSPPPAYDTNNLNHNQIIPSFKLLESFPLASFKNLRNRLCENFVLTADSLNYRKFQKRSKYFSDSELFRLDVYSDICDINLYSKKSFTTDDMDSFF